MRTLYFTLPPPPSLNSYYRKIRNRIIISEKGKTYRTVVELLTAQRSFSFTHEERLAMDVAVYPATFRRFDLDNLFKSLCDSLEYAGVFVNDSQLDWLSIVRCPKCKENPRIEIKIYLYDPSLTPSLL